MVKIIEKKERKMKIIKKEGKKKGTEIGLRNHYHRFIHFILINFPLPPHYLPTISLLSISPPIILHLLLHLFLLHLFLLHLFLLLLHLFLPPRLNPPPPPPPPPPPSLYFYIFSRYSISPIIAINLCGFLYARIWTSYLILLTSSSGNLYPCLLLSVCILLQLLPLPVPNQISASSSQLHLFLSQIATSSLPFLHNLLFIFIMRFRSSLFINLPFLSDLDNHALQIHSTLYIFPFHACMPIPVDVLLYLDVGFRYNSWDFLLL